MLADKIARLSLPGSWLADSIRAMAFTGALLRVFAIGVEANGIRALLARLAAPLRVVPRDQRAIFVRVPARKGACGRFRDGTGLLLALL